MQEVSTQEFIQMAQRCAAEIKDLRNLVGRLSPKADAYDAICTILGLLPQRSQGMSDDLMWRIEKRIRELQEPPAIPPAETAGEEHAND
ncbi:hypothetical protein B5P46_11795 [Rhizobium leguminosarum]|uniref:Uncharacterized protein n=1 Tax=Rhizobium leguminosarum TaxID=384 RepID=A0A4Q1UE30_RHILE|nr:hypothetical protein [Rhizobium leguminosarum]RXT29357.1 hypothetical protein B5P46_11795 [Rhizobium leguminosarum]